MDTLSFQGGLILFKLRYEANVGLRHPTYRLDVCKGLGDTPTSRRHEICSNHRGAAANTLEAVDENTSVRTAVQSPSDPFDSLVKMS